MDEAASALHEALELAPKLDEPRLSAAVGLYFDGRRNEARGIFREVFARKPGLAEWLARMTAAGIVPADPGLLQVMKNARSEIS